MKKKRSCFSFRRELLQKSREAALSAVEIYNNPNIQFKSEIFIVLMNIAWTYLLHAYYKGNGIDYRYYTQRGKRKHFDDPIRYWELTQCLNYEKCPLDKNIQNNLRFLIGIRNEIEHKMTSKIDELITAKFQACCLNYNKTIIALFGEKFSISDNLYFSLQFSRFSDEHIKQLSEYTNIPKNIIEFISKFEEKLSDEEKLSPAFSYKVIYIRENVNHPNQADKAYRFIDEKSALGKEMTDVLIKNNGKMPNTYKPKQVIEFIRKKGFENFNMHMHTQLWHKFDAKNPDNGYGTKLGDGAWYWYDKWLQKIEKELKSKT